MQFSEDDIKKIIKENDKALLLNIFKKLGDYRISEYTAASIAMGGIFNFDVFSKQYIVSEIYFLSHIIPFLANECLTGDENFDIEQYIKSTDEYEKISNLYNEYVTGISELIKVFGNLDIYEIGILYTILLKNGFLSKTKTFESCNIENDNRIIFDILGARITSGFGVCRHEAKLLIDIYNKLNYVSDYIQCKSGLHSSILKNYPNIFFKLKRSSHAIVGIMDETEYLIFDPTWETIGALSKNNKNIIASRKIGNETNNILYCLDTKKHNIDFSTSTSNKSCYLDNNSYHEMIEKFKKVKRYVEDNLQYLSNWHNIHIELMDEISSLEKLLTGYQDDTILKGKQKIIKY